MSIMKINGEMQELAIKIEKNTKEILNKIEEICIRIEKEED